MAHTIAFTAVEIMQFQKTIFADAIHEAMEWALNTDAESIKFAHYVAGLDAMMLKTAAFVAGEHLEAMRAMKEQEAAEQVDEKPAAGPKEPEEETEDGAEDV